MFFRKNGELRENHKFPRFVTKAATLEYENNLNKKSSCQLYFKQNQQNLTRIKKIILLCFFFVSLV